MPKQYEIEDWQTDFNKANNKKQRNAAVAKYSKAKQHNASRREYEQLEGAKEHIEEMSRQRAAEMAEMGVASRNYRHKPTAVEQLEEAQRLAEKLNRAKAKEEARFERETWFDKMLAAISRTKKKTQQKAAEAAMETQRKRD